MRNTFTLILAAFLLIFYSGVLVWSCAHWHDEGIEVGR